MIVVHTYQRQVQVSLTTSSCHVICFTACSLDVGSLIESDHMPVTLKIKENFWGCKCQHEGVNK